MTTLATQPLRSFRLVFAVLYAGHGLGLVMDGTRTASEERIADGLRARQAQGGIHHRPLRTSSQANSVSIEVRRGPSFCGRLKVAGLGERRHRRTLI
jgi:hypothetical protein